MVKEISTKSSNLMTASPHDSVDECMEKMLVKDIRHLPLLDDDGKVIGMLSVSSLFCIYGCLHIYVLKANALLNLYLYLFFPASHRRSRIW